jgi:N-methylhydantoinase B
MTGFSPLDFEVFRHALWEVNEEQGVVAIRTSASHVVYESYDMNTGVLDAEGRGLVSGAFVSLHSTTLDAVVRSVIEDFGADINPGDVFITNDPWAGALHLSDYASVSPFFAGGELLFWTGLVMHEVDVGGPVPGSFSVGSHEVWGEAPIVPPMRLAKDNRIVPEVERLLLRNTRAPELAKVNMRVRMAAAHVGAERLDRLVAKYGVERIRVGQQQIITHVATTLRQRLSSVPDGTWRERVWLDHDGVDPVHLQVMTTLTKRGDRLIVDFDGTDAQTKGGVNCTRPGLEGAVVSAMFSMLCFDLPWSTAGVREVVEIRSEPGTMNDALFPAAVSMASISGAWVTCRVVNGAIGKMLACSVPLAQESQAMWNPAFHGVIFAGTDADGERVTFFPLDQEAGGGGARSDGDGIDAGSNLHSISNAIPNVERNEQLYPVLQVWRRLMTDSAGAGEHRGGCGIEILYLPNEMTFPMEAIVFSSGDDQPGAMGLYGGYPGSVQRHVVIRDSDVFAQLAAGHVPTGASEVDGARHEVLAPKMRTILERGDAHWAFLAGGGGFGDPLDRPESDVRADVRDGLVSGDVARGLYGVDDGAPDGRAGLKLQRLEGASPPAAPAPEANGAEPQTRYAVGSRLSVVSAGDGEAVSCACGRLLARLPDDPKTGCAHRTLPLSAGSPLNAYGRDDLFVLREYMCPGCGSLVGTQVCPSDEQGIFTDTEIEPGHGPA